MKIGADSMALEILQGLVVHGFFRVSILTFPEVYCVHLDVAVQQGKRLNPIPLLGAPAPKAIYTHRSDRKLQLPLAQECQRLKRMIPEKTERMR